MNKIALITGAAQGIGPGRPTARVCAVAPTHVTSSARRKFLVDRRSDPRSAKIGKNDQHDPQK